MQAASGAGQAAMDELELQTREVLEGKPPTTNIFPMQVHMLALWACLSVPLGLADGLVRERERERERERGGGG